MGMSKRIMRFVWRSLIWRLLGAYQGLAFGLVIFFRLFGLDEHVGWLRAAVGIPSLAIGLYLGSEAEQSPRVWKKGLLVIGAAIATVLMYCFKIGIFGQ
jgi:hypothetical protein